MFFNNYSKPGKGVNKREPNQPRGQIFRDVLPRKMWDLIKLNILYLLTAIPFFVVTMIVAGIVSAPLVDSLANQLNDVSLMGFDIALRVVFAFLFMVFLGQGPLTAGYVYIIREHGREHPCSLVSDYFERFKLNFKQGILIWIIDLAVFYLLVVAFRFYMQNNLVILQCIILIMGLIYAMMHIYVYQMMVTFDLPFKSILTNSLILAIAKAPSSLIIVALTVVIYMVIPVAVILTAKNFIAIAVMFLLVIVILPPVTSFSVNFYIDPILDKYINIENKSKEN